MTSRLFTPISLRGLTLDNRVVVAPMCQYSADDGVPGDWHAQHLGSLALSGASLLVIEATGVEPEGRITHGCVGLWNDAQEEALRGLVAAARRYSSTAIGIQLAHAGRKASAQIIWEGGNALTPEAGAWRTVAPSAVPFGPGWPVPEELDGTGIARIKRAFVEATNRAERIGLDLVEIHAAHGYLLHSFLSPISNRRSDAYGGSREKRMRFPLEVAAAVRAAWPAAKPLGIRVSATDWAEGGLTIEDTVAFAAELKSLGVDFVCASSGGIEASVRVPIGPGYQVPLAERIRAGAAIPTRAVGLIATPGQAEEIVASGKADMVALARGFLDDPRWAWHAAEALSADVRIPPQYQRARAALWPGATLARPKAA